MVVVGRIARAQGNRGQVIVDPVTDFPEERFKAGSVVHIQRDGTIESLTIEDVRFHRGRPVLELAGVGTMDAAEALAGSELRVDVDALQPLPPGRFTITTSSGARWKRRAASRSETSHPWREKRAAAGLSSSAATARF